MKMKKLFSEIPYIKTERLVLRKIEETDAEGLAELAHSPTGIFRRFFLSRNMIRYTVLSAACTMSALKNPSSSVFLWMTGSVGWLRYTDIGRRPIKPVSAAVFWNDAGEKG